jgi:hypothetical protein
MRRIGAFGLLAAGLFLVAEGAAACPDPTAYGDTYRFTGRDLYSEEQFKVVAGGENSILRCGIKARTDSGDGWVTTPPDFSVELSGMDPFRLVLKVVSQCDSVLLVNTGAENWYYDDDDNGNLDALITLTRPSNGWLDIWVGTHDGGTCDAVLSLETFDR